MKKIIPLLVIVLAITTFSANAQGIHLGIKAGGNATKLDGESFSDGFKFGYHAGAFVQINFSHYLGIQPELMFNQTNTQTVSNTSQINSPFESGQNIQLNYLSIPVLLNINASKLLTVQLGPQYSILMNKNDNLTTNAGNAFKSGDFALVGGLQLNLGTLNVYGRYVIGLNDVSDVSNENNWKSQQIQAGIGLKIF